MVATFTIKMDFKLLLVVLLFKRDVFLIKIFVVHTISQQLNAICNWKSIIGILANNYSEMEFPNISGIIHK